MYNTDSSDDLAEEINIKVNVNKIIDYIKSQHERINNPTTKFTPDKELGLLESKIYDILNPTIKQLKEDMDAEPKNHLALQVTHYILKKQVLPKFKKSKNYLKNIIKKKKNEKSFDKKYQKYCENIIYLKTFEGMLKKPQKFY